MYIRREKGPVYVVLPDGTKLTRSDLPPADTERWVARRKATVVAAVDNGLIEPTEACRMYQHLRRGARPLALRRPQARRRGAARDRHSEV